MKKQFKILIAIGAIFLLVIIIYLVSFLASPEPSWMNEDIYKELHLENPDEHPDRSPDGSESSWASISEDVEKGSGWKQIVQNSKFQLGTPHTKKIDGKKVKRLSFGTFPVMNGSTVCVTLGMEFVWQHLNVDEDMARDMIEFTRTDDAYDNLISKYPNRNLYYKEATAFSPEEYFDDDPTNLILVTEPSVQEKAQAADANVKLDLTPICMDAFVFITHKDNPVDSLTVEQVQGIYSGKIKNWNEVGGNDSKIVAFQRNEGSGSQTTMVEQVMKGIEMEAPLSHAIVTGMGPLIEAVSEYRNDQASIGYSFKYYIDNQYKNEDVKFIKIDGVSPDFSNIQAKSYPFTTYYYAVIREKDKAKSVGDFVKWIISEEGQACVEQAGYCPLP